MSVRLCWRYEGLLLRTALLNPTRKPDGSQDSADLPGVDLLRPGSDGGCGPRTHTSLPQQEHLYARRRGWMDKGDWAIRQILTLRPPVNAPTVRDRRLIKMSGLSQRMDRLDAWDDPVSAFLPSGYQPEQSVVDFLEVTACDDRPSALYSAQDLFIRKGGVGGGVGGSGAVPQRGRLFKFDFPSAKFWVKIFLGWMGLGAKRPPPPASSY